VDEELVRKLHMPISDLDLSVRASNCLESANIKMVGELASLSESDLLKIRAFGKTSLREVKRKLEDLGLQQGMPMPEGVVVNVVIEDSGEDMLDDDDDE
jgi:DNA-directed RNA polymerase subunit alpha